MTDPANKKSATHGKNFLWVNKDEASISLSSSDKSEAQRIFQFVQHQRLGPAKEGSSPSRRRRRGLARGTSNAAASSVTPGTGTRLRPLSIRPSSVSPEPSENDGQPRGSGSPITPDETRHSESPLSIHDWIARLRRSRQHVPANNFVPGSGVDPFAATPLPITKNIEVLVKYFFVMSRTGSPVDKIEVLPPHLQPIHHYTKFRDVTLSNSFKNKVEFASLLVVMASRMVHLSRIPPIGFARPEYYMHLALSTIREQMVKCQKQGVQADREIAIGVHCLALADCISQRFEASATHVRAMKMLMPILDMDNSMDLFIAQGIVSIDKMIAIETGWLPEYPVMFDPGPMDTARMDLIKSEIAAYSSGQLVPVNYPRSPIPDAISTTNAVMAHVVDILADASDILDFNLGCGFERALSTSSIHPELASVLADFLDVVTVAKYVWHSPGATREDAQWMCSRVRTIMHRLLALPAVLPWPETSVHARKSEALRIALVLIVLRCTNRMAFRTAQPNMRRLQRALEGIDTSWASTSLSSTSSERLPSASSPPNSQDPSLRRSSPHQVQPPYDENHLLLWILLTGHFNAIGEPEEAWFLIRAAFVAEHHLGFRDLEDLRDFMGQYLYSKTRQEQSLMVVSLHLTS